jgi:RNA polymerase sigma factor for flagellar operon FliA
MALADYQKMLQDARGHQLVYLEDMVTERGEEFLERHLVDEGADPAKILEDENLRRRLVQAIELLPERERLMMALYYEQDLNLREIGEVMGVTESRVCQLHSQAVMRLRARLFGADGKEATAKRQVMDRLACSVC